MSDKNFVNPNEIYEMILFPFQLAEMQIRQGHAHGSVNVITFNTSSLRQNGCHFWDGICKCNFLNEDVWVSNEISLKFVPKGPIIIIPAWVQIMAWRRPGDKSLSEPIMVSLLTHVCVTRAQWVKSLSPGTTFVAPTSPTQITWMKNDLTNSFFSRASHLW